MEKTFPGFFEILKEIYYRNFWLWRAQKRAPLRTVIFSATLALQKKVWRRTGWERRKNFRLQPGFELWTYRLAGGRPTNWATVTKLNRLNH